MLDVLLKALSPAVTWVSVFAAAIIGVFTLYVGLTIWMILFGEKDVAERALKVFRELLTLFRRRSR
ncbi:hypothetical protein [Planotetraspora sp. GP83]|uniref:hypothetical protein n=1 Tax=Planotetraspora sp. GP83 TaxID=3156264 RepID=UPI003512E400